MTLAESPSLPSRSLNLKGRSPSVTEIRASKEAPLPEEHSGLWGVPFREPVEMPPHGRLEHVALRAIEVRDSARVHKEAVAPPRTQEGKDDRLGEGRCLQVRNGRLGVHTGKCKTNNTQSTRKTPSLAAYVFVNGVEQRRGPRHEADADASGDDLAEAVEAQHAPDAAVPGLGLEREVRRDARPRAEVHEVVRIV